STGATASAPCASAAAWASPPSSSASSSPPADNQPGREIMSESSTIRWDQDADGVVVLTMDDPDQNANTMNEAYGRSMRAIVDRLEAEKDQITGVVITSAKPTFFAGGDLNDLINVTPENAQEFADGVRVIKSQLRRLETLG